MSRQEFATLQKNSNVVWMPTTINEGHDKPPVITAQQTYYRSQAFTVQVGVNQLIACAYPLLTLATRFCRAHQYHDLTHLHQMLMHEIRVFENQALASAYRQNTITIASYFLCVLLDETITHFSGNKAWQHCSLLNAIHHEELAKERVFHIIDRLLQHPAQHLDILELAYVCLSFGLKNPEQQTPPDEFLEKLDKIYVCIREERGEISQGFLIQAQAPAHIETKKQQSIFSLSFAMSIAASITAVAYYVFSYGLKWVSAPLVQQLTIANGTT